MTAFATNCGRALLAFALLANGVSARAGLFDDDLARDRIEKLRTAVEAKAAELEGRAEEAQKNQLDFANQLESIRADIAKLRGQIEELNYNLEATQKRQKDFYLDLDSRLRKLEPTAEGSAPAAAAPAVSADPNAEAKDYEAAVTLLKASRFKDAAVAFPAFIKAYPASTMLPSAHFWAGYALVKNHELVKGAEMFGKLSATWPADAKAPDALDEQAAALEAAGDKAGARKVIETLLAKYPDSAPARRIKPAAKKK